MQEKLAVYPEVRGGFVVAWNNDIMTGFKNFNEAHAYAIDIMSQKEDFKKDLNISEIKIDRKGMRAVFLLADGKIEEKRYITKKDGSITIEEEDHPI